MIGRKIAGDLLELAGCLETYDRLNQFQVFIHKHHGGEAKPSLQQLVGEFVIFPFAGLDSPVNDAYIPGLPHLRR